MKKLMTLGLFLALGACSSEADMKSLGTFEGSFDAETGQISMTFHGPRGPGGEVTQAAPWGYGNSAGNVYLHTCGTNGDGHFQFPFAPPSLIVGPPAQLAFKVVTMNGTGGTLPVTIGWDSTTVAGMTLQITGGMVASNSCSGNSLPCTTVEASSPPVTLPSSNTDENTGCTGRGIGYVFTFPGAAQNFNFAGNLQ